MAASNRRGWLAVLGGFLIHLTFGTLYTYGRLGLGFVSVSVTWKWKSADTRSQTQTVKQQQNTPSDLHTSISTLTGAILSNLHDFLGHV